MEEKIIQVKGSKDGKKPHIRKIKTKKVQPVSINMKQLQNGYKTDNPDLVEMTSAIHGGQLNSFFPGTELLNISKGWEKEEIWLVQDKKPLGEQQIGPHFEARYIKNNESNVASIIEVTYGIICDNELKNVHATAEKTIRYDETDPMSWNPESLNAVQMISSGIAVWDEKNEEWQTENIVPEEYNVIEETEGFSYRQLQEKIAESALENILSYENS